MEFESATMRDCIRYRHKLVVIYNKAFVWVKWEIPPHFVHKTGELHPSSFINVHVLKIFHIRYGNRIK